MLWLNTCAGLCSFLPEQISSSAVRGTYTTTCIMKIESAAFGLLSDVELMLIIKLIIILAYNINYYSAKNTMQK